MAAAGTDRIVIALDLDAFYVAASRKRDPSLIGLPVGIKQKGVLATISYEARAHGVEKLATIRDGMAQCPEMVLVNGEDLSYFRKLSSQVFQLVSSMIWQGRVEKLGMDELFCDCTEMVDAELADIEQTLPSPASIPPPAGRILPAESEEAVQLCNGHVGHFSRQVQRLFLATHLAQRIRTRVAEEIGLTSSAGVATSKLIAKLVGNVHKPAQQTVFAPLSDHQTYVRRFLDPYPLRALNGFGSTIVQKLCEDASKSTSGKQEPFSSSQLTVALARQIFDWQALQSIFGARLGTRLYNLLQGLDEEPVMKAPPFPAQISIEDTYRGLQGAALLEQIYVLSQSLLRRLEAELVEGDGDQATSMPAFEVTESTMTEEQGTATAYVVREYQERDERRAGASKRLRWKRYPLSIRLSIRQGWDNRVSRQGRMPVEVFDLCVPRKERARVLATSVESALRALFTSDGDKGQGVNLLNIAALDLSQHRPAPPIGGFFRAKGEKRTTGSAAIDLALLQELPPDLRAEIASEYGISLDEDPDALRCGSCGQVQNTWLQHDHARWPTSGLPPARNNDAISWLLDGEEEDVIADDEGDP